MGSNQSQPKSCTPCKSPCKSSSNRNSCSNQQMNNCNQTMTKVVPGVLCNNKQRSTIQMSPQPNYYQQRQSIVYTPSIPSHQPQPQFRYQQNIQPPSIQRTSTCCYNPAPQPYQYQQQQPPPPPPPQSQPIRQCSYSQSQIQPQPQRTSQYTAPQTMNCRQQYYYSNNNNNTTAYVPSYGDYYSNNNNNSYNNSFGCGGCQPVY